MKAKSAKAKGTRLENDVVKDLRAAGIEARRQPGSGIYQDFPHDVEARIHNRRYIIECKARKDSFRQLDGWLGQADILIVRCDRAEPRVYMDWNVFCELASSNEGEILQERIDNLKEILEGKEREYQLLRSRTRGEMEC